MRQLVIIILIDAILAASPVWAVVNDAAQRAVLFDPRIPAGTASTLKIRFLKKPRVKRFQYEDRRETVPTISVEAAVLVTESATGQPVSGRLVVFSARSPKGPTPTVERTTDGRGHAMINIVFSPPPGALGITVQAWLSSEPTVSTDDVHVSLRNFADFDVSFDQGWMAAPVPKNIKTQTSLSVDHIFTSVASARAQVNLFEAEHNWRYSNISAYTTVPFIFTDRRLCCTNAGSYSLGSESGLGDLQTGLNINIGGNVALDVAMNGHNGKLTLVDSFINLGQPRPVNLSDGLTSLEANLQGVKYLGGQRRFLLSSVTGSRARPRRYSNGDRAERDDYYQFLGGMGFVRRSHASAILLWVAEGEYGALRLTLKPKIPGKSQPPTPQHTVALTPARKEWLVGLSRTALNRGPVSFAGGLTIGGLGSDRPYFSSTLRISLHIF